MIEMKNLRTIVLSLLIITSSLSGCFSDDEEEDDFEEYKLDLCAPQSVGYGSNFSLGGKNIGEWDPNEYMNPGKSPIENQVKKYIELLRQVHNPWWTTH